MGIMIVTQLEKCFIYHLILDKCGRPTALQPKIINGKSATRGAWPWQVAIYSISTDATGTFVCGGSLINPLWFVSAAHCFNKNPNAKDYFVVLGDYDR